MASARPAAATGPDARVGDVDRQRAATLLTHATAGGYFQLNELDQRLTVVWSATTHQQLADACRDVPEQVQRAARSQAAAAARDAARHSLRPHLTSYLGVMVLLVTVWLAVGLWNGGWYPWPVWPALGWGVGLLRHVRAATSREEVR